MRERSNRINSENLYFTERLHKMNISYQLLHAIEIHYFIHNSLFGSLINIRFVSFLLFFLMYLHNNYISFIIVCVLFIISIIILLLTIDVSFLPSDILVHFIHHHRKKMQCLL